MTFLDISQIVIFILGLIACSLALYFMSFFGKAAKGDGIAFAMKAFLWEQIISAGAALYFSFNALYSSLTGLPQANWNNVTPEISSILRTAIFGAMILSTAKLATEIIKIQEEKEKRRLEINNLTEDEEYEI